MPTSRSFTPALLGLLLIGAAAPSFAVAPKKTPITATSTQAAPSAATVARWKATAERVTIMRDKWGIPHVFGRTDADTVFGTLYAQAEDDFNRIETNYLTALGRLAEADGEATLWQDLRMRLFIDPAELRRLHATSPAWLQALMRAWADGLNHYLATHPQVQPRVITRFEPWMALAFSEGSIGGDIERVSLADLQAFYDRAPGTSASPPVARIDDPPSWEEPTGSNGFAIAPSRTAAGHALLLINPHTSFFFRSELQMTSHEGLDAYGAVTWGQFFIYQGFNRHIGWMHTSTGADAVDEFAETIVRDGDKLAYRYGSERRPVTTRDIELAYRKVDGSRATRRFTAYATHHGPVVRALDGKWIAVALMNTPLQALQQSWLRTRATDHAGFMKASALKANSSNNTIYADDRGTIAYLHPQFIPKRDDRFDYTRPVDGSDPATDWQGLHDLADVPHVVSPRNGWVMNTNNWPYTAAGADSPKRADHPRYMDGFGENPRGVHAMRVLGDRRDFTLPTLIDAAYDPYLPAFATLVPVLLADHDALPAGDARRQALAGPIALLRGWDLRWGTTSMPTSLAVVWGDALWDAVSADALAARRSVYDAMGDAANADLRLRTLGEAADRLQRDFGSWGVPWGEVNRSQRNDGAIVQAFDDRKPSLPVPFVSSRWGSLASFGAHRWPGTKRYYGTSGNSFVAVVEFGKRVSARAISAGGESGDPASPHFADQAERYATGNLRRVYFWPDEREGHVARVYRPGE